jgi:hypothetical protein
MDRNILTKGFAMIRPRKSISVILLAILLGSFSAAAADDSDAPPKPRDLGPPLVENAKDLKQLGKYAAWLDPKNKQIVLVGETCSANVGLEFLVTTGQRSYESIIAINARHEANELTLFEQIQANMLLLGAKPGHPAFYDPKTEKTTLADGDEVVIEARWKDKNGKTQSADARTWIRDVNTKKPPAVNWVFAGSRMVRDEEGKNHFQGNYGDFICVLNNPNAMFDLPILSAGAIDNRIFEPNTKALPPPETPVTIILKPKLKPKADSKGKK